MFINLFIYIQLIKIYWEWLTQNLRKHLLLKRWSGSSQEGGAGHRSVVGALRFSCAWLHQFPVASVTNDHKQRLKQYTLNIVQFRRSEVQNQGVDRADSFWRLQRRSSFPGFPASRNIHIPWIVAPNHSCLCFHQHISSLPRTFLPSSFEDPVIH